MIYYFGDVYAKNQNIYKKRKKIYYLTGNLNDWKYVYVLVFKTISR